MLENSSPQKLEFEVRRVQVNDCSLGQDDSKTELVPKGPSYPLNSKHVKALHLQQIAAALGLPTRGTAAITRQLIEGKLLEMDREPKNAQVITQGTSENSVIFLVDENGVICKYDSRECTTHVSRLVGMIAQANLAVHCVVRIASSQHYKNH